MMKVRSTELARQLVRRVFASLPELPALSTQQIFNHGLSEFPNELDPNPQAYPRPKVPKKIRFTYDYVHKKGEFAPGKQPPEPRRDHVFNSVRHLKKYVLESMVERLEAEKCLVRRGAKNSEPRMDTIKGQITKNPFEVPSFLTDEAEKCQWLWRLIPDSQKDGLVQQKKNFEAQQAERIQKKAESRRPAFKRPAEREDISQGIYPRKIYRR